MTESFSDCPSLVSYKEDTFEFEGKPPHFNGMEYMNIMNNFLNNEHLMYLVDLLSMPTFKIIFPKSCPMICFEVIEDTLRLSSKG